METLTIWPFSSLRGRKRDWLFPSLYLLLSEVTERVEEDHQREGEKEKKGEEGECVLVTSHIVVICALRKAI